MPMHLEALERRKFFSVTVTEGYPGFYEVSGDDIEADSISISVSQSNYTFTLGEQTYSDCYYIYIHTGGGDDSIAVLSPEGYGDVGVGINGGHGNDSITLNCCGAIQGGMGDDILYLSNAPWGEIYGGGGDDQLHVSGETPYAQIDGGNGADLIDCAGNNYRVVIHGGNGEDTMYGSSYDDELYCEGGADSMVGGAGDDTFYARTGSGSYIIGGDGFDVLYTSSNESSVTEIELIV